MLLRPLVRLITVKHSFLSQQSKANTHQETKGPFEDESWDNLGALKMTCWKISKYWNYCAPSRELSVDQTVGMGFQRKVSLKYKKEERTTVEGSPKAGEAMKQTERFTVYGCLSCWLFANYQNICCLICFLQHLWNSYLYYSYFTGR